MYKLILVLLLCSSILTVTQPLRAQFAPTKAWDRGFGGSYHDLLTSINNTSNGGFILGGHSRSGISGDKSQANKGGNDFWILKTNSSGIKLWDKTFGGSGVDVLSIAEETIDGGFILAGASTSGISGDKTQAHKGGGFGIWVVKTDELGNKLWDKSFGGNGNDGVSTLLNTEDGGFILGGTSSSGISGDKSEPSKGAADYWVIKIDSSGNKQWDKTFGGNSDDQLTDLILTNDGGYILSGRSYSGLSGDKTQPNKGTSTPTTPDSWIVKISSSGNKQWDKTFGGDNFDDANAVQQTIDGGFIIGGRSLSGLTGDKSQASKGGYDVWVIKLDVSGNKVWDKSFGGAHADYANHIQIFNDGSFLIGGMSDSNISIDKSQNNISGLAGYNYPDFWLLRLDSSGNKIWDKTIGTGGHDGLSSMIKTMNNEIILGGTTTAGMSGDKTEHSKGGDDFWIVKLNPTCADLTASLYSFCSTVGTNVNVNVTGIQPAATGSPFWTLTYTANGVSQTVTSSAHTFTLSPNAVNGIVYNLVSITSDTCTQSLTSSLTVAPVAQPIISLIAPDTLYSSVAGNSYEWKFNGTILPITTRKIKATTSGTFSVQVKNTNNCNSPVSADYNFVISGIKELRDNAINLYPNPTSGIINLELTNKQATQIFVYNTLGQVVFTKNLVKTSIEEPIQLDLSKETKGVYTIQVLSDNQVYTRKVVLQ